MKTTVKTVMAIMAAACFAGAGSVEAQMEQPQEPRQVQPRQGDAEARRAEVMNELNTVQAQSRRVQEELASIARQAIEENPELSELHDHLMTVYQRKLTEYGYPSEEELQNLQAVQQRLQTAGAGDLDEEERHRLTQQFNAAVAKLQEAQQKAQSDPEVENALERFSEARIEAMQEVNPDTMELQREQEKLESRSNELQQALQSLLQQPPQQ